MKSVFREILDAVVLSLVVFLLIQTSIQNFKVEGASMFPTLESGQYLIVNKLAYANLDLARLSKLIPVWKVKSVGKDQSIGSPARGEIIVFRFPDPNPSNRERDFVKRVIGIPGDKVAIVWYTAPNNEPKVNMAFSQDGGISFGDPIKIDNGYAIGRVDVLWLEKKSVMVSWL